MLLSGCADYSLPKAPAKNNTTLPVSDTDSRLIVSNMISDVLSLKESLRNQLSVFLEDTVTPTTEMKKSLKSTVEYTKQQYDEMATKMSAYHLSDKYAATQKTIVQLIQDCSKVCEKMLSALKDNDFKELTTLESQYDNLIKQLQGISF